MRRRVVLTVLMLVCWLGTAVADDPPAEVPPTNAPPDSPEAPPTTNAPPPDAPPEAPPTTNAPAEAPNPDAPATMAPAPSAPTFVTGRVTDVLGRPVRDARVYVLPRRGQPHQTKTNKDGRYRVEVSTIGTHGVVFAIDKAHTFRTVIVRAGAANTLDADLELDLEGGEVIKIEDRKRPQPAVQPKPTKDPRLSLPYSDEAVERDAWARAWLLLDVDETGTVARLKLLKRPGYDLDRICIEEAFKLRFEPGRDGQGRPMKTYMLWSMEWPAWGWLIQGNGVAVRRPADSNDLHRQDGNVRDERQQRNHKEWTPEELAQGALRKHMTGAQTGYNTAPWARPLATATAFAHALDRVPCAGSGPLNLDLRNRAYRDCSLPDLSLVDALPWITRETAATAIAELERPDLMLLSEDKRPGSRVPGYVAVGVTGALAVAMLASFMRWQHYVDRVDDSAWQATIDPEAYQEASRQQQRWGKITLGLTAATIAAGGVTLFIWHRNQSRRSFSVQPTSSGSGGSALLTISFD